MNIGPAEILVILLFAFIIVGPERLPKAGKAIGNALKKLRDTQGEIDETLKKEGLDPKSIKEASQNPFLALEKIEKLADALPKEEDADALSQEEDAGAGVTPLSDMETFAERKARIAAEAASAQPAEAREEPAEEHV